MIRMTREMWRYRGLLWDLVVQDFRSRYAGSVIGVFWNILQPAAQVFIFAVILARIIGSRLPETGLLSRVDDPYALSIYICSGLLAWLVFSETIARNTTAFLAHSNLIKKVAFPHPLLIMYQVISGTITLAIMIALFLAVILVTGHRVGWCLVWLPVLFCVQALFMYGLGLILATITAHFRDMSQFVGIFLQLWFWLTPIVYFREVVPSLARFGPALLRLNPLYHLTNLYQNILFKQTVYFDSLPNTLIPTQDKFLLKLLLMTVISLVLVIAGNLFYSKLRKELPDQI
jgi:lipopolysaccharide transport system permease protein